MTPRFGAVSGFGWTDSCFWAGAACIPLNVLLNQPETIPPVLCISEWLCRRSLSWLPLLRLVRFSNATPEDYAVSDDDAQDAVPTLRLEAAVETGSAGLSLLLPIEALLTASMTVPDGLLPGW